MVLMAICILGLEITISVNLEKHLFCAKLGRSAMRAKAVVRGSGIMFNLSINFYGSFTAMSRHCRNLV